MRAGIGMVGMETIEPYRVLIIRCQADLTRSKSGARAAE